MKKLITLIGIVAATTTAMHADVIIDGKSYEADTIIHRMVGPGMMHSVIRLPDYPLNVYVMEMDNTNPNNRVETTFSRGRLGQLEHIADAVVRNRTETKRPIAACNGNFWVTTASQPWAQFMLNYPLGGVVCNDMTIVNPSTNSDMWNGGPTNTGSMAVDKNGIFHAGRWAWTATVSTPSVKDGAPQPIASINRRAIRGEMALVNAAYGLGRGFADNWVSHNETGDNESNNYFLQFKEGEQWAVGKDMTFVVKGIRLNKDRVYIGDSHGYDAMLVCTGASKDLMASVQKDDELVINSNWTAADPGGERIKPQIENLVEGNATVMYRGELTERNYNESYNSMVYSRTAYGTNEAGTHLYMIVIDKSLSPQYGRSIGATTAQMCQLMKCLIPDVYNVVNYDAGGSALMYVDGGYANTSTENTARGVSCGWMMEAVGEEDNEIASIGFADYKVKMPIYTSYTPIIYGYNARGEIVSHDVKGFTISCDPAMGVGEGEKFVAGGNPMQSTITATYNGMTATLKVVTLDAEPQIYVKPTIVIDERPYPVEVISQSDGDTYYYYPATLAWTVDDADVAKVVNGTLYGMKNGTTTIHCSLGELSDDAEVSVELSDVPYLYEPWTDWTLKSSGHKNLSLSDDGVLNYTYGTARAAYMQLSKTIRFFGLPDEVGFTFKSDVPVERILVDMRNLNVPKANTVAYTAPSGGAFEAGVEHTVKLDLEHMGGTEAVSTYPLTLHSLRFEMEKGLEVADHTIELGKVYAHYQVVSNLEADVDSNGIVDVDDVNEMINIVLGLEDNYRKFLRSDLDGNGIVDVDDINSLINKILGL